MRPPVTRPASSLAFLQPHGDDAKGGGEFYGKYTSQLPLLGLVLMSSAVHLSEDMHVFIFNTWSSALQPSPDSSAHTRAHHYLFKVPL